MNTTEQVLFAVDRGVATISINRPHVYNAVDATTLAQLSDAFVRADKDSDVGVIVVTGTGDKAFCAGGDVNWETTAGEGEPHQRVRAFYDVLLDARKPVIARVNGYSIGAGNHFAYLCDLTIAADHALFGQNGPRVASPAQGWEIAYLVRVIGAKRAREVWMVCRRYPAQTMLEWGLVNAVVPMSELDAEVRRWCDELLALSPTSLQLLKATFTEEFASLRERLTRSLVDEISPDFLGSEENLEGMLAFLEKRSPNFARFR